jgi:Calcineurin-like phosphoesterase
MKVLFSRLFVGFLFISTIAFAGGLDRDWKKYPAVVEVDTRAEVFAIGDAHSDYVRLSRLLVTAGLIDRVAEKPGDLNWRAGKAVLVVTGDMIDKGPQAVDLLRLLGSLQVAALSKGGRVIVLAGNHEAEFLADPTAPKGKEFAAQLKAKGLSPREVASCKGDIGQFLCTLPFAARVNEWFFSHGGNSGGRTLAQLNADLQAGVNKDGFATPQLIGDNSILEARLNGKGPGGNPWIDAELPRHGEKEVLESNAAALGVRHLVQGHVPSQVKFSDGIVREPGEMFQRFGLLFLIDTGMSEGVDNSKGAVLHITRDHAVAICPDGKSTPLWNAKQNPDIGRAEPCRELQNRALSQARSKVQD